MRKHRYSPVKFRIIDHFDTATCSCFTKTIFNNTIHCTSISSHTLNKLNSRQLHLTFLFLLSKGKKWHFHHYNPFLIASLVILTKRYNFQNPKSNDNIRLYFAIVIPIHRYLTANDTT